MTRTQDLARCLIADDGRDERTFGEQRAGRLEVLDHRKLRVREVPDDDSRGDAKASDLGSLLYEPLVNGPGVRWLGVGIEHVEERCAVHLDAVVDGEEMEQRRVDLPFAGE